MMRWIQYGGMKLPERWARKGQVPLELRRNAVRVCFPFEIAWIVVSNIPRKSMLMPDGTYADCVDFILNTPGHVIAHRSLDQADGRDWAQEFRGAFHEMIRFKTESLLEVRVDL